MFSFFVREFNPSMKQAVMVAPGQIEIHNVPSPIPGHGEVLLRIRRIGVCGSDVHVYHGKHPYTSYPVVQGHEFSATLEAVGEGVTGLRKGSKVTALPQVVCGECSPCLRGAFHICDELKVQGFQAAGCAQELWVTSVDKIISLPEEMSFEQGALVEPLAVAVHAVSFVSNLRGKRVVVLGAGPIGNLVAQVARSDGAEVLITDVSDYRLEIARQCGLEETSNATFESLAIASERVFQRKGFEIAFECAGVEDTVAAAIENIAKGGVLVIVGVYSEKPTLDLGLVQDRELTLQGSLMYRRQDYEKAVEMITEGRVVTAPLVSTHFSIDNYLNAYQYLDRQGDKVMKVFIDVA